MRDGERIEPRAAAGALACVVLVAIASAAFAWGRTLRDALPSWLALIAASAVVLGGAALLVAKRRGPSGVSIATVALIGAALLRLGALAAPVSLSDDVHRYAWDGALAVRGLDPFAHRPTEVAHRPGFGEARLERLNSPRYYSVYPPLAQAAFAIAALLEEAIDPTLTLRALFVVSDLLAVWALLGACARLHRSRAWALLYAWHPLATWEVAAGGHTEALMLPLMVLAIASALDDRPMRAGVLLGLAASAKLTALVLAPAILVFVHRRGGSRASASFALSAPLVLAISFVPFVSSTLVPHVAESLALYSERFSFNAPIYESVRFLLGYREGWSEPVDPILMPILTAATLACVALLALAQDGRPSRLIEGCAWTYLAYVLLSRVVHPWYLLAPLALGALVGRRSIALYALLVPLSYLRYGPLDRELPIVITAQLVPFLVAVALERARARAHRRPSALTPREASPSGEASLPSQGE